MRAPYRYILPSALLSIAVAGAALSGAASAKDKKERVSKAPAAENIGEPRTCIRLRDIRQTKVHDDYTIDFEMRSGRIYRNNLGNRCSGLGFEKSFSYATSLNQLCRGEIITVLNNSGGTLQPRGSCGLTKFQEIALVDDDKSQE